MQVETENYVLLKGRIIQDPVIATDANGRPFGIIGISTKHKYLDYKSSTAYDRTIYHNRCLVFNAELLQFVKELIENDIVTLSGELDYKKFTAIDGRTKYGASVIVNTILSQEGDVRES